MIFFRSRNSMIRLLFIILCFSVVACTTKTDGDFKVIKARVIAELKQMPVNDEKAAHLIETLNNDGSWPGINYNDLSNTGFQHWRHLSNMLVLANAFTNSLSEFYQTEKVIKTIEAALSFWVENDFFCENWWHNQIGTPTSLVNLMLLVGDKLPKNLIAKTQPLIGRANLNATGARPSGDRIEIAGILAKNLLFINDQREFGKVIKVIEGEIKFSTGRGLQYDYSFQHRNDGVNNTISYGLGYANTFVEWANYVAATRYAFSEEKTRLLIDYYLDGICKNMVFGKFPDAGVKNRSFSRPGSLHARSAAIIKKLLQVSGYREKELKEIIEIRDKGTKPTLSFATFYWQTEHFTFQRPNFFTSVRMYSSRNHNMEEPYNSEGLLNHHRGDGTNHIAVSGTEYYNIAPVFDYQKIPGATIMQKPAMPPPEEIQKAGLTSFVGAVTDGKYGTAAFDFESPHGPLRAKKSWFFFDDEYVCLGAGINCPTQLPVVTTLNQCLLRGEVFVSGMNQNGSIERGERVLEHVNWVFHDHIGYVFPEPATVNLKNSEATGTWFAINQQANSSKAEVKKEVFKLWLNQGEKPVDEKYQYIVVPATSKSKLEQKTSKQHIEILANNTKIQAVKNNKLNIVEIVFYKPGEIKIGNNLLLNCKSAGIVMVKITDNQITRISVADPERKLSKIEVGTTTRINKKGDKFEAIYDAISGTSTITIDLPQTVYAGKSVTINL